MVDHSVFTRVSRLNHLESRWCIDVKRGHIHADEVQENLEKSQIFVVDSVFSKILALGCYLMLFMLIYPKMTMENQPFEDVSPIKDGDFPASHVSFRGCKMCKSYLSSC